MKRQRAKIGGRLHRTLRTARPAARTMLMTTALAWSIGVPPPSTAAAPMARPAASAATAANPANTAGSGNGTPGEAGGLAGSPRGRVLAFSPPSPIPRSTRARRP